MSTHSTNRSNCRVGYYHYTWISFLQFILGIFGIIVNAPENFLSMLFTLFHAFIQKWIERSSHSVFCMQ